MVFELGLVYASLVIQGGTSCRRDLLGEVEVDFPRSAGWSTYLTSFLAVIDRRVAPRKTPSTSLCATKAMRISANRRTEMCDLVGLWPSISSGVRGEGQESRIVGEERRALDDAKSRSSEGWNNHFPARKLSATPTTSAIESRRQGERSTVRLGFCGDG